MMIPTGVTSIGRGVFDNCGHLTSITVASQNPAFSSADGVVFNNDRTTLVRFPMGKAGSYTIPHTVTSIGWGAFFTCASLSSVTIPQSITRIEGDEFYGCSKLTTAIFEGNAPTIGRNIFKDTSSDFTVFYQAGATGFTSPIWTDSAGDSYPAAIMGGH